MLLRPFTNANAKANVKSMADTKANAAKAYSQNAKA